LAATDTGPPAPPLLVDDALGVGETGGVAEAAEPMPAGTAVASGPRMSCTWPAGTAGLAVAVTPLK
jgi:hypothetical protein